MRYVVHFTNDTFYIFRNNNVEMFHKYLLVGALKTMKNIIARQSYCCTCLYGFKVLKIEHRLRVKEDDFEDADQDKIATIFNDMMIAADLFACCVRLSWSTTTKLSFLGIISLSLVKGSTGNCIIDARMVQRECRC